ncbi:ketosynthase chain-length factor [Streptomonospora wellingtoniae]|uniref:Ketosynthase chain-length factor n=1 Tax=Streptomonospora wellingtoniae TaxID=3075544 RepID=A0ABU2KXC1_9ACTN|nr:ketosynthase chain-length factor [Streptomonospora sp. DSM 45055]MDT0303929.1 ketosynthase chain-length factor [Streptomonospora sp. DSM 45055]
MSAPTLVTGLGIVSPNGAGIEEFWARTLAGDSGIATVTRFDPASYPSRLAGEVTDVAVEDNLPNRLLPQTDRMTRLSLVATDWALADAGADTAELPEFGTGVITAASSGGFEFGQNELQKLWRKGSRHVSAYQSFAWFYAVNTGQISIRNEMRGPSGVLVADQAGGLDALGQARRQVSKGTGLIVTGGVDGSICPWGWVAQTAQGRLSTENSPDRGFLPFDARAAGHVPGEGGAILIVEDAESAARRGVAGAYGEIAGYAATIDPPPGSGREPGLRRTVETALADAGCGPGDVDAVFADAAATPSLDRSEADAISAVFGPAAVPVTAPKTMTGRLHSGGGPLDVAAALLAVRDGVIPPTVNVSPDPGYALDLVGPGPRAARVRTALVLARGHGGFNSAVVVREHR